MPIPSYIEARIRRPHPTGLHVVPGSTPVVAFGDAQTATVATLGLNPSRLEFLDRDGTELTGEARRLATQNSIGTADLSTAPIEAVAEVLEDCNCYFKRRPYLLWFGKFRPILEACGASFDNGTACHLDLVQWATDPIWRDLDAGTKKELLRQDAPFLADQMRNEHLRLLLVNGSGVLREFQRTIAPKLDELEPIVGFARFKCRLFTGMLDKIQVVAWSTNLQSSHGVTSEFMTELARRVEVIAR